MGGWRFGWLALLVLPGCDDNASERTEVVDSGAVITDGSGGCAPVEEVCNGEDDDCDGRTDEGTLNDCGHCGATPREVCNGQDDDCDLEIDEEVTNACGGCGLAPAEVCNDEDDDCDGTVDEGVLNDCGACGPPPDEVCNGEDDDCDGESDEGVRNGCGGCGPVPEEVCNDEDDDCDGVADEGVANACGGCGPVPEEECDFADNDCDGLTDEGLRNACGRCAQVADDVCNGLDDDCDGVTDEGQLNACGECGGAPVERCNFRDDDCDGTVDEGGLHNACGGCGPLIEVCNTIDDDCDGLTDEGLLNACGVCGDLPFEACDFVDNDCDGLTDEDHPPNRCGVRCVDEPPEVCNGEDDDCNGAIDDGLPVNACGECGPVPQEECDGVDNDCDGTVDERFVLNACGGCGPAPAEVCNGEDEDCDGRVDEDFAVGRSVDHCGGCGDACPRNNATPECIAAQCVLVACDAGFRDENRDAEDGCELEVEVERVTVFVDAGAEAEGDGTAERPFRTIIEALEGVRPETRVVVGPGVYEGVFEVGVVGVRVEGGPDVVVCPAEGDADAEAVVRVSANHATVSGLQIDAKNLVYQGIALTCEAGCGAVDNEIIRVGGGAASLSAYGILVDGGDGVTLAANYVSGVSSAGRGNRAAGIRVVDGRAVVSVNHVTEIRSTYEPNAGAPSLAGIHLERADGSVLAGNSVRNVEPGIVQADNDANGILAAGVLVEAARRVSIDGAGIDREGEPAAIRGLRGGLADQRAVPGAAVGVLVSDSSDVTLSGLRIDDVLGAAHHSGHPLNRRRGGISTGVRLVRAVGVRVSGAAVNLGPGALGEAGRGPTYGFELLDENDDVLIDQTNLVNGEPAFVADGVADLPPVRGLRMREPVVTSNLGRIVVFDVEAPVVADNEVTGYSAAAGGEPAIGIHLHGIRGDAVVTNNTVKGLSGGTGGNAGGPAVGIELSDVQGLAVLAGNTVSRLVGGAPADHRLLVGGAYGIRVDAPFLEVSNTLVTHLEGGVAAGVSLEASVDAATITRSTFYNFTGAGSSAGVDATRADRAQVDVTDSIFESMTSSVVGNAETFVDYIATWRLGPDEDAEFGMNVTRLEASCFTLAGLIAGSFELDEESACVNAGNPAGGCGEEPGGEACAPDLGHLAGTAAAQP